MSSVTISTHIFKTVDNLDLKLDIILPVSNAQPFNRKNPVVLFIHGGGFVGFNRQHLPPHVVQSCLTRGWPLISADYRLLPQVHGVDIFEDVKDAYGFVRQMLSAILAEKKMFVREEGPMENVILVGQSAGAYLAYMGGLNFTPQPMAILNYYGFASINEPHFSKPPPNTPKHILPQSIQHFLNEPVNTNMTPPFNVFDPTSLLPDLSRNPAYIRPEVNFANPADERMVVMSWLIQEDGLQKWFEGVDVPLDDHAWERLPPLVMVHGDEDRSTPIEGSKRMLDVISKFLNCVLSLADFFVEHEPLPKLFVAKGHGHSFDQPLYLGDEDLASVEAAWDALEKFVSQELGSF